MISHFIMAIWSGNSASRGLMRVAQNWRAGTRITSIAKLAIPYMQRYVCSGEMVKENNTN